MPPLNRGHGRPALQILRSIPLGVAFVVTLCLASFIKITCTRAKYSATGSLTPISCDSNSLFALSYAASSVSAAIFVRARHALEEIQYPISITIAMISFSFSNDFVNACHAFREFSIRLYSCNYFSSARGVPDVFTTVSESNAESQRLTQAHVLNRFKKVPKFSRPLNSGMVDGMNIPILVDGTGAFSMSAAVAGAVARPLRSIYRSNLAKISIVKFAVPLSNSFKNSLLCSAIF